MRKADLGRDIRSLISYAVGCMLGRYSLDKPGLAFAGGNWQEWLAQQDAMTYSILPFLFRIVIVLPASKGSRGNLVPPFAVVSELTP